MSKSLMIRTMAIGVLALGAIALHHVPVKAEEEAKYCGVDWCPKAGPDGTGEACILCGSGTTGPCQFHANCQ